VDGEVVVERRRQWSPEHKAALLAEIEAEGGQVSVVARRHGVFDKPAVQLAIGIEGRSAGGASHGGAAGGICSARCRRRGIG
jgi:transposase